MSETTQTPTAPRRILLATDLGCRCDRALDRAAALARQWDAELVVVHALERASDPFADYRQQELPSWRRPENRADTATRQLHRDLPADDLRISVVVEEGDPAELILRTARARSCDLIVTGVARDETFGRFLLGGVVDALMRRATVPVLVVKARARGPYRHVVVATDFSEASRHALVAGVRLFPDQNVTVFHAYDIPFAGLLDDPRHLEESKQGEVEAYHAFLEETELPAGAAARLELMVEYGAPDRLLRQYAEDKGADLVILGTHGRSRLLEAVLGGTAKAILAASPCDALVVRAGAEA